MTCALIGGKHAAARFHAAPRRIISHGLIRKQTLSTVYKFQSTMGEMIRKAKQL